MGWLRGEKWIEGEEFFEIALLIETGYDPDKFESVDVTPIFVDNMKAVVDGVLKELYDKQEDHFVSMFPTDLDIVEANAGGMVKRVYSPITIHAEVDSKRMWASDKFSLCFPYDKWTTEDEIWVRRADRRS